MKRIVAGAEQKELMEKAKLIAAIENLEKAVEGVRSFGFSCYAEIHNSFNINRLIDIPPGYTFTQASSVDIYKKGYVQIFHHISEKEKIRREIKKLKTQL